MFLALRNTCFYSFQKLLFQNLNNKGRTYERGCDSMVNELILEPICHFNWHSWAGRGCATVREHFRKSWALWGEEKNLAGNQSRKKLSWFFSQSVLNPEISSAALVGATASLKVNWKMADETEKVPLQLWEREFYIFKISILFKKVLQKSHSLGRKFINFKRTDFRA